MFIASFTYAPVQSFVYAQCVQENLTTLSKDVCGPQFNSLKTCFQTWVRPLFVCYSMLTPSSSLSLMHQCLLLHIGLCFTTLDTVERRLLLWLYICLMNNVSHYWLYLYCLKCLIASHQWSKGQVMLSQLSLTCLNSAANLNTWPVHFLLT